MSTDAMRSAPIRATDLFATLGAEWSVDLMPEIQDAVIASGHKVVVLDDDPTGTQTVHDVPVLTEWSIESLRSELAGPRTSFFILTNSRSLPPVQARELNLAIAQNLSTAAQMVGRKFVVVSRSDSTLRGHFPLETNALSEVLGPLDGVLLVPYFETGRRYTIGDIHYLTEGDYSTPVAETQFAHDVTFGYKNSNLRDWVEEKTGGAVKADEVASISNDLLRDGGPDAVCEQLEALERNRVCVANIASSRDLEVFILGLLRAEADGRRFLYRSAASFAAMRAGLVPRALLTAAELDIPKSGAGLIVVGSYVPISSAQLQELLNWKTAAHVELSVEAVLNDSKRNAEVTRAIGQINSALDRHHHTILYTSRELVTGLTSNDSLAICRRVSDALTEVVTRISVRPRFLVAKGGITSSDVATRALRVRRALVLGQILPGIPLWRLGDDCRWPNLIYVSFPGNLGGPTALRDVVQKLVAP